MEPVDQGAGNGHPGEEDQALGDLSISAHRRSTAVVVSGIWKRRGSCPDRCTNRESVPERVAVAAHLTDVVGAKLSRYPVCRQYERIRRDGRYSTRHLTSRRGRYGDWFARCEPLNELRPGIRRGQMRASGDRTPADRKSRRSTHTSVPDTVRGAYRAGDGMGVCRFAVHNAGMLTRALASS